MAKAKSLLDKLKARPRKKAAQLTWYEQLGPKQREEVDEIVAAYYADPASFPAKSDIGAFLVEEFKLSVKPKTVVNHIDGAKPDGSRR